MSKFLGMKFGLILLLLNFINVDATVPLYPGCDTEACSNKELSNYIQSNIFYPSSIPSDGAMMYASITIDENGKMTDGIQVYESISATADDQVYRLHGGLKNRGIWTPRKVDGEAVSSSIIIPIVFKRGPVSDWDITELQKNKVAPEGFDIIMDHIIIGGFRAQLDDDNKIYKIVEAMPRFPGCENDYDSDIKLKACADEKLLLFIYDNLMYPFSAKANRIEGRVYVQFVVEKDGYLTDIKLVRDIGYGCGEAALAAVEGMNILPDRWAPGLQRGRPIRVLYTLPITFKLPKED